jgi:hypothetical protein
VCARCSTLDSTPPEVPEDFWCHPPLRKEVDYCAPVVEFLDGVDHLVEADVHRRQALMSLPFVLSALHDPGDAQPPGNDLGKPG